MPGPKLSRAQLRTQEDERRALARAAHAAAAPGLLLDLIARVQDLGGTVRVRALSGEGLSRVHAAVMTWPELPGSGSSEPYEAKLDTTSEDWEFEAVSGSIDACEADVKEAAAVLLRAREAYDAIPAQHRQALLEQGVLRARP